MKEEWFTISDFIWGTRDTEKAARGGLDIEMPAIQEYGKNLVNAVQVGRVSEEIINETAPDPLSAYPEDMIGNQDHLNLALEAAEKSMVLMQNKHGVLPLDRSEVKKVLVLGKNRPLSGI